MAHVNLDQTGHDAEWHSACVTLVTNGSREGVFSIAISADFDTGTMEMLRELIPAALEQMLALEQKARVAATRMLAAAAAGGLEVCLTNDLLDMERHFGSKDDGVAYLRSLLG